MFAPVMMMNFIQILPSLSANHDWPLQLFYMKNVFLHNNLGVFMDLPPGFKDQFNRVKYVDLKKLSMD